MQLFQKTRRRLGEYFLKKQLKSSRRDSYFYNFDKVSSIGILFNATKTEDFELVKAYQKYLKGKDKKLSSLGYFSAKELPDISYSKAEFEIFTNSDLNWHLKPVGGFIDNFIREEFDILIDLNLENDFPLRYISALSKAKFKIGVHSANMDIYDLMIEVEEGKGIGYFLMHLDHYLMQFNNSLKPGKTFLAVKQEENL